MDGNGNNLRLIQTRNYLVKKLGQNEVDFMTIVYKSADNKKEQFEIICELYPNVLPRHIYELLASYNLKLPKYSKDALMKLALKCRSTDMKYARSFDKGKITEEMELDIVEFVNAGHMLHDAVYEFKVSESTITKILGKYKKLGLYIPYTKRKRIHNESKKIYKDNFQRSQ